MEALGQNICVANVNYQPLQEKEQLDTLTNRVQFCSLLLSKLSEGNLCVSPQLNAGQIHLLDCSSLFFEDILNGTVISIDKTAAAKQNSITNTITLIESVFSSLVNSTGSEQCTQTLAAIKSELEHLKLTRDTNLTKHNFNRMLKKLNEYSNAASTPNLSTTKKRSIGEVYPLQADNSPSKRHEQEIVLIDNQTPNSDFDSLPIYTFGSPQSESPQLGIQAFLSPSPPISYASNLPQEQLNPLFYSQTLEELLDLRDENASIAQTLISTSSSNTNSEIDQVITAVTKLTTALTHAVPLLNNPDNKLNYVNISKGREGFSVSVGGILFSSNLKTRYYTTLSQALMLTREVLKLKKTITTTEKEEIYKTLSPKAVFLKAHSLVVQNNKKIIAATFPQIISYFESLNNELVKVRQSNLSITNLELVPFPKL